LHYNRYGGCIPSEKRCFYGVKIRLIVTATGQNDLPESADKKQPASSGQRPDGDGLSIEHLFTPSWPRCGLLAAKTGQEIGLAGAAKTTALLRGYLATPGRLYHQLSRMSTPIGNIII
jgi:hypothetical protein